MKQQKFLSLLAAAATAASCTLGTWQTTARAEDTSGTAAETSAVPETVSMDDISALRTFLLEGTAPDGTALPDLNQDKVLDARDLTLAKRNLGTGFGLTNLRADIPDILLNTKETVTFTVEAEQAGLPEKTVALCDPDSEKPAAYMYDDGTHGDETASDGIYTAQLELQSDDFKNVDYYAAANGFKSDPFRICFYRNITQEECGSYAALTHRFDGIETLEDALEIVRNSEEITEYTVNEEMCSISFTTIYHITGCWEEPFDSEGFLGRSPYAIDVSGLEIIFEIANKKAEEALKNLKISPAHPEKKDIVLLAPFHSEEENGLDATVYSGFSDVLAKALDSSVTKLYDDDVTIQQVKHLEKYGTVIWFGHGTMYDFPKDSIDHDSPCLIIGEKIDYERMETDTEYYNAHKTFSADQARNLYSTLTNSNRVILGPDFFDYYYMKGSLKNSLWCLSACCSMMTHDISDYLIKKDIGAVFGYTEPILVAYAEKTIFEAVMNNLVLSASNAWEAHTTTNSIIGPDCTNLFMKWRKFPFDVEGAVMDCAGDPYFRLVEKIEEIPPDDPDTPVFPDEPDFVVDNELDFKLITDADTKEQYYAAYGRPGNVDVVIPSTHEGKPVKAIGVHTYNKTHLRSVTIPSTITEIPDSAFHGSIRLTKVSLPSNLTKIGSFAFWSCKSLKSIDIPASVQEIGDAAFGESALEKFEFTSKNHFDSIYRIFYGCKDLREVVLNVEADELDHTFEECTSLEKITFPKGLKKISSSTFYNCSSIKEFEIPDGVEELGDNALQYFTSLESLVIPDSVKVIGIGAVSHCFNLKKAVLPKSIEKIGNGTFGGCTHLTDVQMPQDVEVIGRSAFYECTSLRRIELPDTVKTIEAKAFSGCWGLVLDPLPPNIREIGAEAFSWCKFSSPNVQLPKSLQKLSLSAFDHCESILYVLNPDMEFAEPTITEQQAFDYVVERLMLHGYAGSTAQQFAENPDHPCKFFPIDPET